VFTLDRYWKNGAIWLRILISRYGSRIYDLTFTDAGFTYNCEYQTAWIGDASMGVCGKSISELTWHGENLLTVQTKILTNLNDMIIEEHIEEI